MDRRKRMGIVVALLLAAATLASCEPLGKPMQTVEALAEPVEYTEFNRLIDSSDIVVVGRVVGPGQSMDAFALMSPEEKKEHGISDDRNSPITVYDVQVMDCWKGGFAKDERIQMYLSGGTWDNVYYTDNTIKDFQPDRDYMLFLVRPIVKSLGYYMVNSTTQGIVAVEGERVKDRRGNPWLLTGQSLDEAKQAFLRAQEEAP